MTTLARMKENILKKKLRIFFHYNRHKVTKKPVAFAVEPLKPHDTIGRRYSCVDTTTHLFNGFEIVLSSSWIRRYSDQTTAFKQLLLHELAHTDRRSYGHDIRFRKTARRIGCTRDFTQSCVYK